MADLGVYIPHEASDEKKENKTATVPDTLNEVVHDRDTDITTSDKTDEPPPYVEQTISDDPESYYDTSSSLQFNSQSFSDESLLQITMTEDSEEDPIQEDEEDDESLIGMTLSPLERLEKFSISKMVLQRLVVTRELSNTIHSISLTDAVDKALPIIIELGKDTDDSVREALAGELDKVIYFYYQNAPPLLSDDKETQQPHIPANAFASTVIDFLLDQNTTLASIAQQSIVTVAAELADTPKSSEQYEFNQSLLNNEIFQGIILGLISIVNSGNQQEDLEEEKEMDMATVVEKGTANVMDSFSTAIVEKVPLDKTPENKVISSATNAVLKHYDDGGINLAKMVCLMLISALAQVFGPEGCTDKFLPIVESMVSDPMFYVRKEAAAAVGSLSTSVDPKTALDRLLPLYLKLSVDTIWHVRRACVFALPFLCEVLPNEVKTTIAVNGVELFKNDVSRNVRNSLADITGEMISKFLPDDWKETGNPGKVPEELLDFFLSLGNTTTSANQMFKTDTERIHNCAYNYPAVVLTAGVEYWDTHLKDTYLNLTKDYQLKVRRTFAYSLHDIARIIGPERTERDLVQIFALYLMDLDDVKQGVLEHLSEFLGVLAITSRNEYIPILAEVWDGVMSNWHLRDILANQLRDISRLFDASRVVEHILPLAIRACHDEFAAVRETAVEIFPVILDIVKRTVDDDGENLSQIEESENDTDNMADRQQKYALALLNHVMEKIDDLVRSSAHRTRLVFTQICRSLLDAGINPADFGSFFLPRLVGLAKDKVVNVRIATSRTIKTLCSIAGYRHDLETITFIEGATTENDMTPGRVLDDILYLLSTDKDRDVRYYVEEFITPECLLAYQEKKVMQDSIIAKELAIKQSEKIFPPTLPAHLIMIHSPALSNLDDEEEEEYESDHDIHNTTELPVVFEEDEESEEIYHSTESPMDIVDDYDDVEDMSLSGNMGTSLYEECIKDEDQVIPFTDIHTSSTLDEEDDIMMESPSDNHEEVAEKAQHVYLSKIPAHVVLNSSVPPVVPADNN